MKKTEYLNEESYQNAKKKIIRIALIVLIVGIVFGGSLIVTGIIKTNNAKKASEQEYNENNNSNVVRTEEQVQADIDATELQIDTIDTELDNIDIAINRLRNEQSKIFTEDRGFSDRYYEKDDEIAVKEAEKNAKNREKTKLRTQLTEYKSELNKIQSGFYDVSNEIEKGKQNMAASKYIPLYIFGAFVIISSCMISFAIYMFAKRREMLAFTTQQVMPVAQEGIEKFAPTIGKAGASVAKEMAPALGDIAKEISKGIKDGVTGSEAQPEKKNEK